MRIKREIHSLWARGGRLWIRHCVRPLNLPFFLIIPSRCFNLSRSFPRERKQPSYGSFSCYPVKITPDFRIYNHRIRQLHEQKCLETFNKIKLYIQNYQLDLKSSIHKDYGLEAHLAYPLLRKLAWEKNCSLEDQYQSGQEEGYGKKREIKSVIITVC